MLSHFMRPIRRPYHRHLDQREDGEHRQGPLRLDPLGWGLSQVLDLCYMAMVAMVLVELAALHIMPPEARTAVRRTRPGPMLSQTLGTVQRFDPLVVLRPVLDVCLGMGQVEPGARPQTCEVRGPRDLPGHTQAAHLLHEVRHVGIVLLTHPIHDMHERLLDSPGRLDHLLRIREQGDPDWAQTQGVTVYALGRI